MKVKLSSGLAYVIGLWKARRTREGIGIVGNSAMREIFIKCLLDEKIAPPDKIRLQGESVIFHHSAYREFFREFAREPHERLKHRNEKSAAYLAGLFDGCGGVRDGIPYFARMSPEDEMLIARLDFVYLREREKVIIAKRNAEEFMRFVNPFLKLLK